jgi:hypothetical protein
VAEDLIVETAKIECGAVARRELASQALDLALADLVGQGLPWPGDVSIGLDHRVGFGQTSGPQEVDRALTRPAKGVQTRVDDQPGRPPGLTIEHAETFALVPEQAHLVGQPFAVQAPAFDVGAAHHARPETPEPAEVRVLHLEADLEVMAGHCLVIGRRGEVRVLAARQVVTIGEVDARPRAIG